jgi:oligoribonuclease NrnB/cAMP/cGMP phosphodiesterase (DHH superfamily)
LPQTIVIYHAKCFDGFTAAWVYSRLDPAAEFVAANYDEPPPDVRGKNVAILDFSYKRPVLERMIDDAGPEHWFCVLDHHKTAKDELAGLDGLRRGVEVWFDMEKSGAGMTWEWFCPHEPMPDLVAHVQDRDLWKFKMPGTKEVMAFVAAHEFGFSNWSQINEQLMHDRSHVTSTGKTLLQAHEKQVGEIIAAAGERTMVIAGRKTPVVNCNYMFASDVAHRLCIDVPFAATYVDTARGRQFSLRSREDGADVEAIAKLYGGGGHPHAAGFTQYAGWDGELVTNTR